MVVELSGVQFGLKSYAWFQNRTSAQLQLQINAETGNEELVWTAERGSKCRTGEEPGGPFCPIVQASNNARCPVFFYKAFRSHRPTEVNNQESPFYLAINHKRKPSDTVWYMNAPLGKKFYRKVLEDGGEKNGIARECDKPCSQKDLHCLSFRCRCSC